MRHRNPASHCFRLKEFAVRKYLRGNAHHGRNPYHRATIVRADATNSTPGRRDSSGRAKVSEILRKTKRRQDKALKCESDFSILDDSNLANTNPFCQCDRPKSPRSQWDANRWGRRGRRRTNAQPRKERDEIESSSGRIRSLIRLVVYV